MKFLPQSWHDTQVFVGALLAFGAGWADLWHFHALASTTDGVFIVGGLAALGLNVAFNAGQAAAAKQ